MRWILAFLAAVLPLPRAAAAGTCALRATEWRQDGSLRAAADGPAFGRARASPELLAVEVELGAAPDAVLVRVRDSVGRIEAWMPLSELRVRVDQALHFADDTLWVGAADLRVREVAGAEVRVEPFELPGWVRPQGGLGATLPCSALGLVEPWRGDLRAAAVGQAARGERVFLSADDTVPVSRIPGTSPAVRLLLDAPIAVEQLSTEVEAARVVVPLPGMLLVGWVPKELIAEGGVGAEVPPAPAPEPSEAPALPLVACKKEVALWATTGGGEYQLGALNPGVRLALGAESGDRQAVLAVPDARAWAPAEGVGLWIAKKEAKGCKGVE
jgi:hypothetical protein